MTRLALLFPLLAALAAPAAAAATQAAPAPGPAGGRGRDELSLLLILDAGYGHGGDYESGFGLGGRYRLSLAPQGVIRPGSSSVRDSIDLEFGADLVRYDYHYHTAPYDYHYAWWALRPRLGVMWDFWINDAAGNNLARWYGSGTSARPRIGGTSLVLDPVTLTGGWDTLQVEIDSNRDYSHFYFNGTLLGGLSHSSTGAGNTVGSIWLGRQNTTAPGQYVWFDNIVIPAPHGLGDFDHDHDVDQEDFGHFQTCLSGSGLLYLPGCADADFDGDNDVDGGDLGKLLGCLSGKDTPADPYCAG
jgi:hypothetical protein